MKEYIERKFKLSQNSTSIRKEIMAGLVTFLTMSYILAVNPAILGQTGMDSNALFTATAIATIIGTIIMAFMANLPIALAPGMGLNTFFAFTVVKMMGYSWQFALTAVLIEGIIFILLTFFNVREIIIKSLPSVLKDAIPVGIGLFITFIGLHSAGIVESSPNTMVTLGDMSNHNVWIACIGIILTSILLIKNVNGAFLIGIVVSTIFAILLKDAQLPEGGKIISTPPSIMPLFAKFNFNNVFSFDMLIVVFTFLFVNLFDTIGTLIGVTSKAGLVDENGNVLNVKKALLADAIGTTLGSILGTSPVTAYVESASGVSAGGRTGLTAISVAFFFTLALFLSPLFKVIPAAATAPALIIVGLFMMSSVVKINFDNLSEAVPTFITIIFMPFTYSIANGIVFGILSYVIIKSCTGKYKEISAIVYILALLFIIKLTLDGMHIL